MSRGSSILTVRIEESLLSCLDKTIDTVNERRKGEPYTRSSFIQSAIRDKIDHVNRSRKKGKIDLT